MAIDFPASPSVNDTHTDNGSTWVFDGEKWNDDNSASVGMSNVVEDTTPQLGGTLDINGNYLSMTSSDLTIRDGSTIRFTFARTTGQFTATGDVTAFSDSRLKGNIEPINNALDKVSKLNGVTFSRNNEYRNRRYTGVIAQDVLKVLPEAVHLEENGYYSVSYGNLVGLLIESIKELKEEINELKGEK